MAMLSVENLVTTALPVLAIVFVGAIAVVNLFLSVRKRFPVKVNCWFCNQDTKVPYDSSNSWFCPGCTQYNGFTEDGDYNREIPAQYQCRLNPRMPNITDDDKISYSVPPPHNGLCFGCNRNQELKIHQLASFVPEVEENYDQEVEEYQQQLEQIYKLCSRCERVLKRTLNDIKRNILGSKLAQIGTKGLKVFDLHMEVNEKQNAFRKRKTIGNVCLAVIIGLLVVKIGQRIGQFEPSRAKLELVFSPEVSQTILIVISYVVAAKDTLVAQWNGMMEQPVVVDSVNQLKCAKNAFMDQWKQKVDISEAISGVIRDTPEVMLQKNALTNLALISLAGMLMTMKSHVGNGKPIVIVMCSILEMFVKTEYGLELMRNRLLVETAEMFLVSVALLAALGCIGQTAPKIQHSDNLNSSFHKIYSQQANDADCSDTLDDNSSILQDGSSICSRREDPQQNQASANNLSAKSMDTTKSISPSVLSASTMRYFMDNSFSTVSSPKSRYGGSTLTVNRLNNSFHEQPARNFSRQNLPECTLAKVPSVSVDSFTTAIPDPNDSVFSKGLNNTHAFSTTCVNNLAPLYEEDRFGDDIDRLSISGRMSVSRRDLTMVNNPFASHHFAHDDGLSSLRQRKVTISPPQLGTLAESGASWIAGGYWGMSPQKNGPEQEQTTTMPYMSRTSSQSSGFESQPTRRPTPEEPAGVDLDRVSLFSEPAGIFPSSASSVSAFQPPNPRLNQTLPFPLPSPSPNPSHNSFFSRISNHTPTNSSRNLFGERSLFPQTPPSIVYPSSFAPSSIASGGSILGGGGGGHFYSPRSTINVFPPHQSQTPVFGSSSSVFNSHHHQGAASFACMQQRTPSTPGGNGGGGGGGSRRSLLNLSKLSELPEGEH